MEKRKLQHCGFLLVDKSEGGTSFDVVKKVRSALGGGKVGHAGTLDPMATGLLIIAIGKSTKKISAISQLEKEYVFQVQFGRTTTTDDTDGETVELKDIDHLTKEKIVNILPEFTGKISQEPPQFSAVKVNGKRAYRLARAGIKVELKEKNIEVYALELLDIEFPYAHLKVVCSKGTYVRSLARDFGRRLGCGACVSEIRRLRIGPFCVDKALEKSEIKLSQIEEYLLKEEKISEDIVQFLNKDKQSVLC